MRQKATREQVYDLDALVDLAERHEPALDKERYREPFRTAFRELEPRKRNVLRMHLLDGLTIDESRAGSSSAQSALEQLHCLAVRALPHRSRERRATTSTLGVRDLAISRRTWADDRAWQGVCRSGAA